MVWLIWNPVSNLSPYPKFSRFTTTKNPQALPSFRRLKRSFSSENTIAQVDSVRPRLDAIIVGMEDIGHVTKYGGIWWNVMEEWESWERTVSTHLGISWMKRQRSNPSQNKQRSLDYINITYHLSHLGQRKILFTSTFGRGFISSQVGI